MTATADQLESLLRDLRALMDRADELMALADNGRRWEGITPEHRRKTDIIVRIVSVRYGLAERLIYSRARQAEVSLARQVCMTLIRAKVGLGTYQTGKLFSRDHQTVTHAEECVNDRIATDSKFASRFALINIEVLDQLKSL